MGADVFRSFTGLRFCNRRTLLVLATMVAVLMAVLSATPAHAEPTPPPAGPNPPGGNAPAAAGAVAPLAAEFFGGPPADCPTTVADNAAYARAVDWRRYCLDAVALAPTYEAERAIKWAFARLGAPYASADKKIYRDTNGFDCSSYVARAFRAAGAQVAARNGVRYEFFPYFGFTGAYVPTSSPISMWGGGYSGTNVIRVEKKDLRPGDLVIQFFGDNPALSQGNQGHAKIFLGGGRTIEAGGAAQVRVDMGYLDTGSYFTNEWYFRYQSLGTEKPGYSTQLAGEHTYKMQVGPPNATVIGNLTVAAPAITGHTRVFTCGTPMPETSNTSFVAGRTTATAAAVKLDGEGNVCIYLSARAHLVWDQLWSSANLGWGGPQDALVAHNQVRLLDTRKTGGRLPAGGTQVIATGAPDKTVMATLTAVEPTGAGHTKVFPCDVDGTPGIDNPPATSTNNFDNARTANLATVRADSSGNVCVFSSGATDLLWDQAVETTQIDAGAAVRMYDSRLPYGSPIPSNGGHRLNPNDPEKVVKIATQVPYAVVIGNLTATEAITASHVKTVPCMGLAESDTSVLNFPVLKPVSNAVVAQADWNGDICFKVKDWTHLIWDQVVVSDKLGYNNAIERKMDSREPIKRPVLIS